MSPEQTRGLPLDKRSDIWSFGCVLYEMLTGSHPFTGLSASDIVVAILERDPDLDALPATTPARVRWLLRRCLEKDPTNRLHDIADARIELDEALRNPEATSGESRAVGMPATRHFVTRERAAWLTAGLALTALVVALMCGRGRALDPPPGAVYRSAILLPEELRLFAREPAARFALSPDGRRLALIASSAAGCPRSGSVRSIRSSRSPSRARKERPIPSGPLTRRRSRSSRARPISHWSVCRQSSREWIWPAASR